MPLPVVWPVEPNAKDGIIETYGYMTDVIPGYRRGIEQRAQLRRHPVGGVEFSFLCDELREAQRISVLLQRKRAQQWIVPLWQYRAAPTANVSPGAVEISVVTANIPFTDPLGLGPYAVLWRNSQEYEVVYLNAIFPSKVELAAPVAGTWPSASVELLPCRVGRLEQPPSTPWLTPRLLTGRVRFDFDAWSEDNIVPTLTDELLATEDQVLPV